jgi:hypothetical protein
MPDTTKIVFGDHTSVVVSAPPGAVSAQLAASETFARFKKAASDTDVYVAVNLIAYFEADSQSAEHVDVAD